MDFDKRGVKLLLFQRLAHLAKQRDPEKPWSVRRVCDEIIGSHETWTYSDDRLQPEKTLTYERRGSLVDSLSDVTHFT